MNLTVEIFVLLILFLFSAFFSGSETALFSLSKIDRRRLKDRFPYLWRWVQDHLEAPRRTLGTILIGNLFVNTWATALTTLIVLRAWGKDYLGLTMFGFTLFLIVFCEMLPKIIAVKAKEKVSLAIVMPLQFAALLFFPFRLIMRFFTDRILALMVKEKLTKHDMVSEEELKVLVKIGEEEGVLDRQERYMLQKLLDFGERPVKAIMTPRTDLIALDVDDKREQHEEIIKKYHFSHIPVFQNSLDEIIGVIESQDYILEENSQLRQMMKKPLFIPESKRIDELLEMFRKRHENFAICVDEFGGTAGIVTLEDILEEIFGEFYDEYAEVENPIRELYKRTFLVEAKIGLDDFNEHFASNLSAEEATTLGGYLLEKMGEVPSKGSNLETEFFEFRIKDMIRQRIHHVIVRQKP